MRKTIAISGASGLVGTALTTALQGRGNRVIRLVRREPLADNEVKWDWVSGSFEAHKLSGIDAVVHLAGQKQDNLLN